MAWIGSRFELYINRPRPLVIGINLVALAIVLTLWWDLGHQSADKSSREPGT